MIIFDSLTTFDIIAKDYFRVYFLQAGRIIKVRLKNFMNHAEFDYKPTERLNFLNGSNGSGKSAILTAIVFGLGLY